MSAPRARVTLLSAALAFTLAVLLAPRASASVLEPLWLPSALRQDGNNPTPLPDDDDDLMPSPSMSPDGMDESPGPSVDPSDPDATDDDGNPLPGDGNNPAGPATGASPSPSPEPVCVDARALAHLPASELVFGAAHRRGDVLCDRQGSCATPGHVVQWQDEHMMMSTYCERHGPCKRQSMAVNSPRMRHGLRVKSRTPGLQYTALAARYASRVEEAMLRVVLRLGM